MKRLAALVVAVALLLAVRPARADTFAAGSYIIPMDTTYQDSGMLKAYGLVYNLLYNGVPVEWVIEPTKAYQGTDFTASATDLKTSAVIMNHGYRGGPFVIDSSNAAAALPVIQKWWTAHPMPLVTVHSASASFTGTVARYLIAAPRVAINADGNQQIAIMYLNAASIPDSQGNAWPNTSPDLLTPAAVAGPTTTNHCDGALFDGNCIPKYCQFMSMHWDVNAATMSPETVWETRTFLGNRTHFYAECQAVDAFENTIETGQTDRPGHFLTTNGLAFGPQPMSVDYYNPALTFAQIDGTFGPVGGSEPSYALAPGSMYKAGGIVMLTGHGVAPGGGQDVWMTGYLDGACPPDSDACGNIGKVSYLGGHQFNTNTPISMNPQTQGVRLFLNSLFDSVCASQQGFPSIQVSKGGPAGTTTPTITYTLQYYDAGPIPALNLVMTDPLPAGATFVSATNGGTFSGGKVTWKLGDIAVGQGGSVSVTVTFGAFGTYVNTATLAFNVGLNVFTQPSNPLSTLYAQCITDSDCPAAKPICDPTTNTCRACQTNADCAGEPFPICDTVAGSANLGTCVDCTSDANCASPAPRCNLSDNSCVQCLSAADCGGASPSCNLATDTCVSCKTDADCGGATPACEPWGACGQCSATNKTQCTGATKLCDTPSGTCVGCETNADCAGATPVCNTATHTCQPCQSNASCAGNPSGPACATSGMKQGQCVPCTSDATCTGATPRCDTVSNTCVACLTSADCPMATPACNPATSTCVGCLSASDCPVASPICNAAAMTCGPCTADYTPTPTPGACPTPALPACQPQGSSLAGECTQCSGTNQSACGTPGTPVCVAGGVCGCTDDFQCFPGNYCDTGQVATGFCQPGCTVVNGMSNCPVGQTCSQQNGMLGVCQGASSSSGSTSSGSTSSGSTTSGTGGATATSSGATTSGTGGTTATSSGTGGTSGAATSSTGNTTAGNGGMASSSGSTSAGSGGKQTTSSGATSGGPSGSVGAGGAESGSGGGGSGPGSQGSCACRASPADASPLPLTAIVGLVGIAWRRRSRRRAAA